MSTVSKPKELLTLKTNDGKIFKVDEVLALQMCPVRDLLMLEEWKSLYTEDAIPLLRVNSRSLSFIIKWWSAMVDKKETTALQILKDLVLKKNMVDYQFLMQLVMASNYLQMDDLLKASSQLLAEVLISCGSVDNIRQNFNVPSD